MSWRDKLIAASFRGVPFHFNEHDADLGRRVQVHEYPLRDKPYAEDLGRKARALNLDAFVLGPDYMALRNRLIAAVETAGPGVLRHPYLGEMLVTVTACKLRESTAEGGVAKFALSFVEAGEDAFVSAQPATGAVVDAAGTDATAAAQTAFVSRFNVAAKPAFVAEAAKSQLAQAMDTVRSAADRIRRQADQVAVLTRAVVQAKQQALSLVYAPASAAQALVASILQLAREVAYGPREAFDAMRVMLTFGLTLPNVPATTPSRKAQAANQAAMSQLVRVAALGEACLAATQMDFTSYQDALAVRNVLADAADALLEDSALDDAVFDALRALRTAAVNDVAKRGADALRVVPYTVRQTMPALVVAQQLYADATRADEIVLRNGLAHPGFVRGQRVLEVLSDG